MPPLPIPSVAKVSRRNSENVPPMILDQMKHLSEMYRLHLMQKVPRDERYIEKAAVVDALWWFLVDAADQSSWSTKDDVIASFRSWIMEKVHPMLEPELISPTLTEFFAFIEELRTVSGNP